MKDLLASSVLLVLLFVFTAALEIFCVGTLAGFGCTIITSNATECANRELTKLDYIFPGSRLACYLMQPAEK